MYTIEEVTYLFKDGAAELPPITGKPTNDTLKRLQEVLRNLLQAVEHPGGTDAKGLITSETTYQAAHTSATFNCLDRPLEAYDPALE